MRAVVTGASGFLGGRVAQMLCERGAHLTVLTRKNSDLSHLKSVPLRIVQGDLLDQVSLESAVEGATHIFHCAACSTDWAPWETYFDANVTGTQNLLAAASGVRTLQRFVHVSTTDVYGYPHVPCGEDGPLIETALPYNRTKLHGELSVWSAIQDYGLKATIVRPATIYGPRGKDFTVEIATLLRQRIMAVIDSGKAPGGFTYVDNVAQAMLDAAESPNAIGQAYNIADGTGATWSEYLTLFAKLLGSKPPWIDLPLRFAMSLAAAMEAPHRYLGLPGSPLLTRHAVYLLSQNQEFPIDKARRDLAFAPVVTLEEGLRRSAEWLYAGTTTQSTHFSP
jgi:nucleoside-diphosphate-sugar epimerase